MVFQIERRGSRQRDALRSINGIGTSLRGWSHRPDGTAFATEWFVLVYLPILPLRRFHVRVLTDFANEPFVPAPAEGGWIQGGFSWSDPVEVLARLPLSWPEIGWTYWRAYALVPLLCVWPILLSRLGTELYRRSVGDPLAHPPQAWVFASGAVALVNLLVVLLVAARRMRGYAGEKRAAASGRLSGPGEGQSA